MKAAEPQTHRETEREGRRSLQYRTKQDPGLEAGERAGGGIWFEVEQRSIKYRSEVGRDG